MRNMILLIALTITASASANDVERFYELGSQMCNKAFACTQGEFDKAAQQMPQMSAFITQMKDQFAKQCAAQQEHKYLSEYADPKNVDKKLMRLTVACFEKQANAGCEYYKGEKDLEDIPECKALFNYHDQTGN